MDSPATPLASARTAQPSTCAGPLAGVLHDELTRLQQRAHDVETELVTHGKPLTSPSLADTQQQIATIAAGLEVAQTCDPPCAVASDRTQPAANLPPLSRSAPL